MERFPQLSIDVVGHHNDVQPYLADLEILFCFSPPMADHVVRDAPKLKWIQALGTGIDNIVDLPSLNPEVLVTNVRGIHGPPVSEAAIAYMLSLARDLPTSTHAQERKEWLRHPAKLLNGKTVGILGVGLIAEYLAPICKALRHDHSRHQRLAHALLPASTAWRIATISPKWRRSSISSSR